MRNHAFSFALWRRILLVMLGRESTPTNCLLVILKTIWRQSPWRPIASSLAGDGLSPDLWATLLSRDSWFMELFFSATMFPEIIAMQQRKQTIMNKKNTKAGKLKVILQIPKCSVPLWSWLLQFTDPVNAGIRANKLSLSHTCYQWSIDNCKRIHDSGLQTVQPVAIRGN